MSNGLRLRYSTCSFHGFFAIYKAVQPLTNAYSPILAAFNVVVRVTLSGEVTKKILSAAAITGFNSS